MQLCKRLYFALRYTCWKLFGRLILGDERCLAGFLIANRFSRHSWLTTSQTGVAWSECPSYTPDVLDFVGNKVADSMVAAEERLDLLSDATIRDAVILHVAA